MNKFNLVIGKKLRQIRTGQNMSLRALSEKTGISHPALSNYELGKRSLYISDLKIICDCLSIDMLQLLDDIYKNNEK